MLSLKNYLTTFETEQFPRLFFLIKKGVIINWFHRFLSSLNHKFSLRLRVIDYEDKTTATRTHEPWKYENDIYFEQSNRNYAGVEPQYPAGCKQRNSWQSAPSRREQNIANQLTRGFHWCCLLSVSEFVFCFCCLCFQFRLVCKY